MVMKKKLFYCFHKKNSSFNENLTVKNLKLLKPFQIEGIRFLHYQYTKSCGAVLNDEKALGKTYQTVIFLTSVLLDSSKQILILCNEDTLYHWIYHFHALTSLNVSLHNQDLKNSNVLVTSLNHKHLFMQNTWDIVVIDNLEPLPTFKEIQHMKCVFKLWITNENLQVDVKKLHKILDWVSSSNVGSLKDFQSMFSSTGNIEDEWKQRQYLTIFCRRWILRRTEKHIQAQLPLVFLQEYHNIYSKWLQAFLNRNSNKNVEIVQNSLSCNAEITRMEIDQERLSPSIIDCLHKTLAGRLDDKNDKKRRKGKDDTGLKIKRSKPKLNTVGELVELNTSNKDIKLECNDVNKTIVKEEIVNESLNNDDSDVLRNCNYKCDQQLPQENIDTNIIDDKHDVLNRNTDSIQKINNSKLFLLNSIFTDKNTTETESLIKNENMDTINTHSENIGEKKTMNLFDKFFS